MPNNDNGQRQRNAVSGASIALGAVGVIAGLAMYDHVQAREENRESVVQGVGRWLRENILEPSMTGEEGTSSTPTRNGAITSSSEIPHRLSQTELSVLPVRTVSNMNDTNTCVQREANELNEVDEKAFCVFCRENYSNGDTLLRLPCFHEFHEPCVRDYLQATEEPRCPICRHPVIVNSDHAA